MPNRQMPAALPQNTDAFGRTIDYLRIAVTDRCSLRCVYCMPEAGVPLAPRLELLSFEEIWRVAASARRLGFVKFRITGGEPLEVKNILELVAGIRRVVGDATVGLTTNGMRLTELARSLKDAGVDRLNVSLDAVSPECFRAVTRKDGVARVLAGIDRALAAGFSRLKLNAVIVAGVNESEIVPLAGLARERPVDVRFIEQMPLDGDNTRGFLGAAEILRRIGEVYPLTPTSPEDPRQSAQSMYRSARLHGLIGMVAPRTKKFCHACNRLRLTPKGELKGCLLQAGTVDLKARLRRGITDDELDTLVALAIGKKPQEYPDDGFGVGRSMRSVGG
jgi:GTP 3',8-cyclase